MARNIGADGADVFRAVIDFGNYIKYEGPYAKEGAAKARVTFWQNYLRDSETGETRITGHVEKAVTTWEVVS